MGSWDPGALVPFPIPRYIAFHVQGTHTYTLFINFTPVRLLYHLGTPMRTIYLRITIMTNKAIRTIHMWSSLQLIKTDEKKNMEEAA